MEQNWSYKVTSERWKGTELWGSGLTGMKMGGSKAENSDLRYCCREHSSGLRWQGQLQLFWKGEELELTAWGRQGGADTSLCDRHTWHCPETQEVPSKDFYVTGMTYLFPEMPLPLECHAVKEGAGMVDLTVQQWCQSIPGAAEGPGTSLTLCLLLQLLTGLSWRSLFRHAVLLSHRNRAPLTAQVRTTHQGF